MPDIAMCVGEAGDVVCQRRSWCYRYTATPTKDRQSYFMGLPIARGTRVEDCERFWNNEES